MARLAVRISSLARPEIDGFASGRLAIRGPAGLVRSGGLEATLPSLCRGRVPAFAAGRSSALSDCTPQSKTKETDEMKTLTSILAACVILAIAAAAGSAATSTYPGSSGSQAVRSTQQKTTPAGNVDLLPYLKQAATLKALKIKNKALAAKNGELAAKNKDLASSNSYLNSENQRQLDRIIKLIQGSVGPRPPIEPLSQLQECQTSGNGCTPAQNCEIWGMDCDQVPPPVPPAVEAPQGNQAG
jgi:hypothetical protein